MSNLVKTKKRINSITNTRKVTNAMNLVASVKLKRFKHVMEDSSSYVKEIRDVMVLLNSLKEKELDLSKRGSSNLYIVVNSNLGLCASYNNDLFRFVESTLTKQDEIITIGIKGLNHFKTLNYKLNDRYVSLNEKISINDINKLAAFLLEEYQQNKYANIYIVYMDYLNMITFKPCLLKLLPIELPSDKKVDLLHPIIEPDVETLLNELTSIYLSSSIYHAVVTSQVSEQASRNNAMKNATDNADDLLEKLKLEYNKDRQGAITQEITEVVAGSNNDL